MTKSKKRMDNILFLEEKGCVQSDFFKLKISIAFSPHSLEAGKFSDLVVRVVLRQHAAWQLQLVVYWLTSGCRIKQASDWAGKARYISTIFFIVARIRSKLLRLAHCLAAFDQLAKLVGRKSSLESLQQKPTSVSQSACGCRLRNVWPKDCEMVSQMNGRLIATFSSRWCTPMISWFNWINPIDPVIAVNPIPLTCDSITHRLKHSKLAAVENHQEQQPVLFSVRHLTLIDGHLALRNCYLKQ